MNDRLSWTDALHLLQGCEVACKEWNDVPEDGLRSGLYDNTLALATDMASR